MRKEKTNRAAKYMVIFMAAIMVLSVFGVVFFGYNQSPDKVKYNGIPFTRKGSQWSATINSKEAFFDYFPAEVENINISRDIISRLSNKAEIDATYSYNATFAEDMALAVYGLSQALALHFNTYVRAGFTEKTIYKAPIITCANSTAFVPVIYFKSSNETSIYTQDSCIIIESGKGTDFIRIKDRLLYALFGII